MKRLSLPQIDPESYRQHCRWLDLAVALAAEAGKAGDVPVGAVIVDHHNQLIAQAANRKHRDQDPTAHAEILAIRAASKRLNNWRLDQCILYVTLEPCPMCSGAIVQARVGLLVYGLDDPKTGAIRTVINIPDSAASNHRVAAIAPIREKKCRHLLQTWFQQTRNKTSRS